MVANGHKPNFVPTHFVSRRRLRVTIIHLGPPSPTASSALPAPNPADHGREAARATSGGLLGFARGGVCRAPIVTNRAVRSYRTISPLPVPTFPGAIGRMFSVALSLTSRPRPVGVTHHRVLSCSDFPPRGEPRSDRLSASSIAGLFTLYS